MKVRYVVGIKVDQPKGKLSFSFTHICTRNITHLKDENVTQRKQTWYLIGEVVVIFTVEGE